MTVEESDGRAVIAIRDNGPGMDKDMLNRLIELLPEFSGPRPDFAKGEGLGLRMSNKFVQLNDGTLSISSQIGAGTKVEVSLPVAN